MNHLSNGVAVPSIADLHVPRAEPTALSTSLLSGHPVLDSTSDRSQHTNANPHSPSGVAATLAYR